MREDLTLRKEKHGFSFRADGRGQGAGPAGALPAGGGPLAEGPSVAQGALAGGGLGTPTPEPVEGPESSAGALHGPVCALWVSAGCEICAEAEAAVQAAGVPYVKHRIAPSANPGRVLVWTIGGDPEPQEIDAEKAPAATPALLARDAATGAHVLAIGLDAVERIADALASGASLLA